MTLLRNKSVGLEKIFHRARNHPKLTYPLFPSSHPVRKSSSPRHKHLQITRHTVTRTKRQISNYDIQSHNYSLLDAFPSLNQGIGTRFIEKSSSFSQAKEEETIRPAYRPSGASLCASLEICHELMPQWNDTCTVALRKGKPIPEKAICTKEPPPSPHPQGKDLLAFSMNCFNFCVKTRDIRTEMVRKWIAGNSKANLVNENVQMECDWYGGQRTRYLLNTSSSGSDGPQERPPLKEQSSQQTVCQPFSISIQQPQRMLRLSIGEATRSTTPEASQLHTLSGQPSNEFVGEHVPLTSLLRVSLRSEESFHVKLGSEADFPHLHLNIHEQRSVVKPNVALHMERLSRQWRPYVQKWALNREGRNAFQTIRGRRGTKPNMVEVQAGHLCTTQISQDSESFPDGSSNWIEWLRDCVFGAGSTKSL